MKCFSCGSTDIGITIDFGQSQQAKDNDLTRAAFCPSCVFEALTAAIRLNRNGYRAFAPVTEEI